MVKRLKSITVAVMLFTATQLQALSLGEITLESTSGEPLQARIEVLDSDGLSPPDISVMVASAADFERFDLERNPALDSLEFRLDLSGASPVLYVSSAVAIDEPFLSLVLDTRWPAGRVLTEYTLRLESPAFSANTSARATVEPVRSVFEAAEEDSTVAETEDTTEPAAAAQLAQTSPAASSATPSAAAVGERPTRVAPPANSADIDNASTLTVNAGDTLWELALRARPDDSVTVQQTMLALQRLNPDAFLANNINQVKRGEVLRVPELNEIRRLAAAEAVTEVTRQNRAFAQRDSGSVPAQPTTAGPGAGGSGAAQGELRVVSSDDESEEQPDASASAANDQSSTEQADNDERLNSLEDSLAQRAEELDRLDLENTELNARLAMLQQQIASAQEIIRLRDLELAQLQQQIAEEGPEQSQPEQTTTITMAPDAGPLERFFNFLISNTWALLAAAALLILVLVLVLMRRNKAALSEEQRAQRDNDNMTLGEENEDELMFSGVAAAAASAAAEQNSDDELDRNRLAEGDAEDAALVYGADGVVADPGAAGGPENNYPENNDSEDTGFDDELALDDEFALDDTSDDGLDNGNQTAALADSTDDTDSEDDSLADWGESDDGFGSELEDDTDELPVFDDSVTIDEKLDDDDLDVDDTTDLDWPEADEDTIQSDAAYDISDEAEVDLASELDTATTVTEPDPIPVATSPSTPLSTPFSTEAEPAPVPEPEPEPEQGADDEFDDLAFLSTEDSFDADDEDDDQDFAFLSDSDEAATKLDLARAYIDMGDAEGAREILGEVVQEGTETQRKDAEDLLSRL